MTIDQYAHARAHEARDVLEGLAVPEPRTIIRRARRRRVVRVATASVTVAAVAFAGVTVGGRRVHAPGTVSAAAPSSTIGSTTAPLPAATLRCSDFIGAPDARPPGYSNGVVMLPTKRALQANLTHSGVPAERYFAKQGLVITAGVPVVLVVPKAWRNRLSIGWGSPGARTYRLRVPSCPAVDQHPFLAYAGGYWVPQAVCAPLAVEAGGTTRTVHIGVGAACPGESAPPPPN